MRRFLMTAAAVTVVAIAALGASCYNPELAPAPFLCGVGGACPDGFTCYGGICMDKKPECMQPGYVFDGTVDRDMEPNNYPGAAYELPCGDPNSPTYGPCSCPPIPTRAGYRRKSYTNGLTGLAICPAGDNDFYKFYLYAGEVLDVDITYDYGVGRDLDMEAYRSIDGQMIGEARSTNDNEHMTITADIEGFYYILVRPKNSTDQYDPTGNVTRPADLNDYLLQLTLNPMNCNQNGTCDPYETAQSCASDCSQDSFCGNLVCEPGENEGSCAQDCFCGNGTCDPSETSDSCPSDCPQCS
ncbi:MAG: PPC domain-containing protein [Deltaproteobacteria bacterium]|nr:PPC domain-containing protein [Deltaproteobacteria bacterium]